MSNKKNTKKKSSNSNKNKINEVIEEIDKNKEIKEEIKEEVIEDKKEVVEEVKDKVNTNTSVNNNKGISNSLSNITLVLLIILSLVYFVIVLVSKNSTINDLINSLIVTLFSIIFGIVGITYKRKDKRLLLTGSVILLCYFILNINNNFNIVKSPISVVPDFSNKSLTYVMKWASKNNVLVNQDYEYSDMIDEYKVISQDINSGTTLSGLKEISVSISDGPNPYKEVVVPSMINWDSERVINFVNTNYLEKVNVEFDKSSNPVDTVISQDKSGNLKRNDELNLKFSYGEELGYEEFKLIDFTNKSKFEIEFFMKQHQIKYELEEIFSNKIKKGFGVKQEVAAGENVKVNDTVVKVYISKGPKIKVPNLTKMSVNEITEWAIKNKLRLEFNDKYDDTVKEGNIVSTDKNTGDIIEQGTTIKVTLSRGKLKMPKVKSMGDFREWADKYEIKYEEKHEFSDSVEIGGIISTSYKSGETIKNGSSITIVISDGKKISVPNVSGMSKSSAVSKLEDAGLSVSVSYKYSNDVAKDKVISQSISSGSEVGKGTTIYITVSNGKAPQNSYSNNNSSNNNSKPSTNNTPAPQPVCNNVTVWLDPSLINNTPSTTCSLVKSRYPNLKFACSYVANPGLANGMISNANSIDGNTFTTCQTITLQIVSN